MKFQRHYPATRVEISAPDTLLMIPMDIILIEQVLINLMETPSSTARPPRRSPCA